MESKKYLEENSRLIGSFAHVRLADAEIARQMAILEGKIELAADLGFMNQARYYERELTELKKKNGIV